MRHYVATLVLNLSSGHIFLLGSRHNKKDVIIDFVDTNVFVLKTHLFLMTNTVILGEKVENYGLLDVL